MSKDTIYREDAINAINLRARIPHDVASAYYASMAINAIRSVPTTDKPQGKWIRDRYWSRGMGMGEDYGFFYKCSLCGYEIENEYTRCSFNFCPNCGARMKGVDDDTN